MDVQEFKEKFPHLAHLEGNDLWDAMELSMVKEYVPKEGDDKIVKTVKKDGYTFYLTKGFVDSIKENFTSDITEPFGKFGLLLPNKKFIQMNQSTFQEIGLKHGTDKAVTHLYMDNYEKYLGSWRDKEFTLLELGVSTGASIRMWRELFPEAKVYGVDNNPDCAGDGIFIGSQIDFDFMNNVLNAIGSPDVVIDDCSHVGDLTIETFKHLFTQLNNHGLYFIEDTATFYNNHYSGEFEANGRSKVFNFLTGLAYDVDIAGRGMTGNVSYAMQVNNPTFDKVPKYSHWLDSIHIHPSLWLFKRR